MKVAVILVNWNGWQDTIECLESILKSDFSEFRIVVCDNASTDGSFEKIQGWARGEIQATSASPEMARFSHPPCAKPAELLVVDEHGNHDGDSEAQVVLIQTGENLGFAGGNNVGIRFSREHWDSDLYWLLNNDTVIDFGALGHLKRRYEEAEHVGMMGTTIYFYDHPDTVQALNGSTFNSFTCVTTCNGGGRNLPAKIDRNKIEEATDMISGASLVVSREFIDAVGLMDETYFLYFEEMDWASRNQGEFEIAYSPEAIVYHKQGASAGSGRLNERRSLTSEFYMTRSRIKYTWRFNRWFIPSVLLVILMQILLRLFRGEFAKARIMIAVLLGKKKKI